MNFLVEDWGGKYQSQDISAKKGIGVQELLEKVLLEAEMLDLKANPNRKGTGTAGRREQSTEAYRVCYRQRTGNDDECARNEDYWYMYVHRYHGQH